MFRPALRWLACIPLTFGLASGAASAAERHPDLEGVWSYAWITTLERPARFAGLELTDADALAFETQHTGVPEPAKDGLVGQDSSEWWEMGGQLGRIAGRARSSWIVYPADGRIPYSAAGLAALQARQGQASSTDNPEARPAAERCLMGVGGTSLPPMLNAGYNALLQITQTRDHVVLLTEMNVGPRIITLNDGRHEPGGDWNGHSTGRWEGDTLVIETTGFHPGAAWRTPSRLFISPAGRVTESFTKTGPDEIRYAYAVDDPATFTQVWRGEMPLRRATQPMFEFACHEGNYSLAGVLAGGREQEREAKAAAK